MHSAPSPKPDDEVHALRARYARRNDVAQDWRYHRLNPAALWPAQEREPSSGEFYRVLDCLFLP
jgi:hypothetical protein